MFFEIDFHNGLAVYDQVVRQVKYAVAAKLLAEGSMVPSVREVSAELTINPNTVTRAYRQLQDDGILVSVRGTGLAVAAGAFERCCNQRLELIRERLQQVFVEAQQSRLDPEAVRTLVEQQLAAIETKKQQSQSKSSEADL
jgi:GntR family transcriptional regulator